MTKKPRLNDLQLVLLSAAAARDTSSLLPLPERVADDPDRVKTAMTSLKKRGLVDEQPVTDGALAWRGDGDELIGMFITAAGRSAIGAGEDGQVESGGGEASRQPVGDKPRLPTKAGTVLQLLKRTEGATLAELVGATGWLPHTARAHLTGLRKKGHVLEKTKRGEATCYRIAEAG